MPLFKPDSYPTDAYGHVVNGIAHAVFVGLLGFGLIGCAAYYLFTGELPYRRAVVAWGSATYLAYELADQGWQGLDTINDWAQVTFGLSALLIFAQAGAGSVVIGPDGVAFTVSSDDLVIFFWFWDAVIMALILAVWMAIGALRRWYRKLGLIGE